MRFESATPTPEEAPKPRRTPVARTARRA
jgi:hypothetical protein